MAFAVSPLAPAVYLRVCALCDRGSSRACRRSDGGRRSVHAKTAFSDRSFAVDGGRPAFFGQFCGTVLPALPPPSARSDVARCTATSEENDAGETAPKTYYWRQGYYTPSLILYTKSGCCLCEALLDKILDLYSDSLGLGKLDFVLDVRDIEMKEEWFNKYQYEVPVLVKAFPRCDDDSKKTLPRPSPRLTTKQLHAFLEKYFDVLQPSPEPEFELEEYTSPIEAELIAQAAAEKSAGAGDA